MGIPRIALTLLVVSALVITPCLAQRYHPSLANPKGPELTAVYISSTWCIGNRAPGLHEAIDSLKLMLQRRAQAAGRQFRMIGVAIDWSPDSGLAYLKEFGEFDELVVGRNWFNIAAERFVWADTTAISGIPQLLVYEQTVTPGQRRVGFSASHVVKRVGGGDKIVQWVRDGAPIP